MAEESMMERGRAASSVLAALALLLAGCGGGDPDSREGEMAVPESDGPGVLATNAFYYYVDLPRAWAFYTRTLGFQTVADYGFAKILQVSPTSYLTLVDEARGMHDSMEPKSVTLAVVTEEVEGWWDYLRDQGVEMRSPLGPTGEGRPHDGFVAVDPEGYLLEFERFNSHPENDRLLPFLDASPAHHLQEGEEVAPGVTSSRPADLGVRATVLWLYYRDLEAIQDFYTRLFRRDIVVDQGWAKVFPVSATGFLGFVDGERGLHSATEEKAVTVSFFTHSVEDWLARARQVAGFSLRTEGITSEVTDEGSFVRTFVGYDPEGYFLEWDTFLDVPPNRNLLRRLRDGASRP
jgi:catechol 2,3-dioxygenase-like lactoylglutathione lyase family enzyme